MLRAVGFSAPKVVVEFQWSLAPAKKCCLWQPTGSRALIKDSSKMGFCYLYTAYRPIISLITQYRNNCGSSLIKVFDSLLGLLQCQAISVAALSMVNTDEKVTKVRKLPAANIPSPKCRQMIIRRLIFFKNLTTSTLHQKDFFQIEKTIKPCSPKWVVLYRNITIIVIRQYCEIKLGVHWFVL